MEQVPKGSQLSVLHHVNTTHDHGTFVTIKAQRCYIILDSVVSSNCCLFPGNETRTQVAPIRTFLWTRILLSIWMSTNSTRNIQRLPRLFDPIDVVLSELHQPRDLPVYYSNEMQMSSIEVSFKTCVYVFTNVPLLSLKFPSRL